MTFFFSKETIKSQKIIKDSVHVVENKHVFCQDNTSNSHASFFSCLSRVSTNLARTLLLTELFRGL